jgi:plastocyanin
MRSWPALAVLALLGAETRAQAQSATVEGAVITSSRRLDEIVVYLLPDQQTVPTASEGTPVIDQLNLTFVPKVLAVSPGTTVEFLNSDPILHNVFSPERPGPGFDLGTYPKTESRSHTFEEIGAHVILCNVHPEMYAYVVVVPTPFRTTVDEAGGFRFDHVPSGRYTVKVWQRGESEMAPKIVVGEGGLHLTLDLSSGDLTVRVRG